MMILTLEDYAAAYDAASPEQKAAADRIFPMTDRMKFLLGDNDEAIYCRCETIPVISQ